MGFISIAIGGAIDSLRSSFGDQLLDFLVPPSGISDTAVVFPAITQRTNAGRGQNTRASENIITNGSVVVVPEGYGLLTFQDGAVTAVIGEPGAYKLGQRGPELQVGLLRRRHLQLDVQDLVGALQVRRPARARSSSRST